MSVQSEIDRINGNVASTYTALSEMGATMPETQNSDNLPETVRTVPTGGGASVQSDWNQSDETAADFVKNKTHYKYTSIEEILPYTQLLHDEETGSFASSNIISLAPESEYSVNYNGTIYHCKAIDLQGMYVGLGNMSALGQEDTGEPFCIVIIPSGSECMLVSLDGATEVSLGITGEKVTIKQLDAEYASYNVFYYGEDVYMYKDIALTEKVTYGDLMRANLTGAPLYLRSDYVMEFLHPVVYIGTAVQINSEGVGQPYGCVRIPTASSKSGMGTQLYFTEYCTAEYVPET